MSGSCWRSQCSVQRFFPSSCLECVSAPTLSKRMFFRSVEGITARILQIGRQRRRGGVTRLKRDPGSQRCFYPKDEVSLGGTLASVEFNRSTGRTEYRINHEAEESYQYNRGILSLCTTRLVSRQTWLHSLPRRGRQYCTRYLTIVELGLY